ncbi:zinc finger protein 135-like [Branchiostoma floridae]|uniref:Zinc finger protein 135-like n=1 Tax=Branchiostoma floridae TaxID=7739 RepID=A0A9J7MXM4_BRAFL|nr:zinc finger protein 135-like [Branchiostoma floridae]
MDEESCGNSPENLPVEQSGNEATTEETLLDEDREICSEDFILEKDKLKPTGDKPFRCDQCDYSARCKSHLDEHLYTHSGEKPYQCSHCDHRTAYKSALARHMRRKHAGEKVLNHSTSETGDKEDRTTTMEEQRDKETPYQETCAENFTLEMEKPRNADGKPYKCPHYRATYGPSTYQAIQKKEKHHRRRDCGCGNGAEQGKKDILGGNMQ